MTTLTPITYAHILQLLMEEPLGTKSLTLHLEGTSIGALRNGLNRAKAQKEELTGWRVKATKHSHIPNLVEVRLVLDTETTAIGVTPLSTEQLRALEAGFFRTPVPAQAPEEPEVPSTADTTTTSNPLANTPDMELFPEIPEHAAELVRRYPELAEVVSSQLEQEYPEEQEET